MANFIYPTLPCGDCPHSIDCCNIGKCLDQIADGDVARYNYSNSETVMRPAKAAAVEAAIRAGATVKRMCFDKAS